MSRRPVASSYLTNAVDLLLEAGIWTLAAWTVLYHLALRFELGQSTTLVLWLVVCLAIGLTAQLLGRRVAVVDTHAVAGRDARVRWPDAVLVRFGWIVSLAAGLLVAFRVWTPPGWWLVWLMGALGLVPGFVASWWSRPAQPAEPSQPEPPAVAATDRVPRGWEVGLVLVLAVTFALLSVYTRRADSDDSFLVNRSLYTEQHSGHFAARDTMFADEAFESSRPDLAPTSFEPLIGVLARLSGSGSQTLTYLIVGPLMAGAAVLALWRFLRTLRVKWPAIVTAAGSAFLVLDGVRHQSFGNYSFARSWQGKVVLVAVVVPLLWHLGVRAAWSRRGWDAAALVAANIAAVGLSSTGIIVAPAVSVLALLCVGRFDRWIAIAAVAAAAYPVGALLLGSPGGLVGATPTFGIAAVVSPLYGTVGEGASLPWYLVLGTGLPAGLATLCVLAAWTTVTDPVARRVLVLAPAAVLVALGPGTHQIASRVLDADSVYWRVVWIAPVPAMVGLVATAGLRGSMVGRGRRIGAVALPVVMAIVLMARGATVLAETNLDKWVLDWDVVPERRQAATELIEISSAGDVVAAPAPVNQALVMLSVDVRALNPEDRFLRGSHATPAFAAPARLLVSHALETGLAPPQRDAFRRALDDLSVDTACSSPSLEGDLVETELVSAGFEPVGETQLCVNWRR